jgi:penicillin-binding protein 2
MYRIISEQQKFYNIYEYAPRGLIYSSDNCVLVNNKFKYILLYDSLNKSKNYSSQINVKLSKIFNRKIELFEDKKKRYGKSIKFIDNLTLKDVFKIQENNINLYDRINIIKKPYRVYCFDDITSHLTGYTSEVTFDEIKKNSNYKIGDYIGRGGIEQNYDKYIRGKNGYFQFTTNVKGEQLNQTMYVLPKIGANVYSTINSELQKISYEALKNSNSGRGAVVVLENKTGAVISLVSLPSFDANKLGTVDFYKNFTSKGSPFFNRTLQGCYPPGSIFKIITFSTIADILNIDMLDKKKCDGNFKVGNRHYVCWYKHGHGELNIIDAMSKSCNIFFYKYALEIGIKNLLEYSKNFYIGLKTGIDLPNEKKGFLPTIEFINTKKKHWFKGDTLSFAIGQNSLCVTPLQMACMISIVANKGIYYMPYVVEQIKDYNNNILYKHERKINGITKLNDKTWNLLHSSLLKAVETGTGWRCNIGNVKISGKTGTAQNYSGNDHSWFISYAPSSDPEISIAVIVENAGSGGLSATQVAKKIYNAYFDNIKQKQKNIKPI